MGYLPDGTWDWAGQAEEEKRQAIRNRNDRLTRQEEQRIAKNKIESAKRAKAQAGAMMMAEYRKAGLEPRKLDEDGHPTISLSTMLYIGWEIEAGEGGNILVKPKKQKKSKRSAVG